MKGNKQWSPTRIGNGAGTIPFIHKLGVSSIVVKCADNIILRMMETKADCERLQNWING